MKNDFSNIAVSIGLSPKNIEYIIASKGLFQRLPIEQDIVTSGAYECIMLWRGAIDRALLDMLKGPEDVGRKNYNESIEWVLSPDFRSTCSLAQLHPDYVRTHITKTILAHKDTKDT